MPYQAFNLDIWFAPPITLWMRRHLKTLQDIWNIFAYTFPIITTSHYVCLKMQPHQIVACIEIFSTSQKLVDNLITSKFNPPNYLMNIGDSSQVQIFEVKVQLGSLNPCLILILTHFHTFISFHVRGSLHSIAFIVSFDTLFRLMLKLELESFQVLRKDKHQNTKWRRVSKS